MAKLPGMAVQPQRTVAARQGILARFGAREVTIDRQAIEALPGVVQDGLGDIHIRGGHRNLQYRLNGVRLPESISGFAQVVDARLLRSVSVLTGALPAQFRFRTNAVVDPEPLTGALDPGAGNWRGAATAGWPMPTWR